MGAPSNPRMTFPGCPTCGRDVASTVLHEGVLATPPGTAGRHVAEAFRTGSVPATWLTIGGAPEHDMLTLAPCGHILEGDAAHAFSLAAVNMTFADLRIEVRVEVPAALNVPDRRNPRILTKSAVYSAGQIRTDGDVEEEIARHIRGAADAITAMLGYQLPAAQPA